ncbi:Methyltransferase type 11 [Halothece sp. PCC 7418]|uniref:class I SAM-dependent methyltransferase n=1 Tax=Halothece sp. (strain PCC 7418) TaxID=65093 RepID=UPI0002A07811|nr:class I SAM-dependent methyltransferase [Halothece sp. PCC 7418]AFZ43208.1 Methyltransferase type 11 [Halothece sp. PCC 7418]
MDSLVSFNQLDQALQPLAKVAYQTVQNSKSLFALTHKEVSYSFTQLIAPRFKDIPSLPSEVVKRMKQRRDELLAIDWEEAEQGVYPTALLFDHPWDDFVAYYPLVWLDLMGMRDRLQNRRYQEFSSDIDTEGYPSYYLQNFHYQTDGYLSDLSANLYDLQVELLFNGGADAMRRRILAPFKNGLQALTSIHSKETKVLDVACGTGRTLRLLRGMLPKVSLHGIDLSPNYLRKANQLLSELSGELPQLMQGNAEILPYSDQYFHGISCVFTFHELPPKARQNVINEVFRVLKSGGIFVICDSIQAIDHPELLPMMEDFPRKFHEPYYKSYIYDDLGERLSDAGFTVTDVQSHFASKYWIAQKTAGDQ